MYECLLDFFSHQSLPSKVQRWLREHGASASQGNESGAGDSIQLSSLQDACDLLLEAKSIANDVAADLTLDKLWKQDTSLPTGLGLGEAEIVDAELALHQAATIFTQSQPEFKGTVASWQLSAVDFPALSPPASVQEFISAIWWWGRFAWGIGVNVEPTHSVLPLVCKTMECIVEIVTWASSAGSGVLELVLGGNLQPVAGTDMDVWQGLLLSKMLGQTLPHERYFKSPMVEAQVCDQYSSQYE